MDLNYVKKLVKLLSESDVDEIEIEEEGKKIRIARHNNNVVQSTASFPPLMQMAYGPAREPVAGSAITPLTPASISPAPAAANPTTNLHEIKSPIVGTFYLAPAPDAAAFVQVGSAIEPGNILCIIEAMKLMNEIEADVAGKIVKVMVENGQPVEYDQTLFLVEKA